MVEKWSRRDVLKRAVVAGAALTLGAREGVAKQSPSNDMPAVTESSVKDREEIQELDRINREMQDAIKKGDLEKIRRLTDDLENHLKRLMEREGKPR
ncbi:MAG: twin-arginine translocation signal domain-containing protein [Patescibacteria group bacterium]